MQVAAFLHGKLGRAMVGMAVVVGCAAGSAWALAATPVHGHGVLVHLNASVVASFDAHHSTQATRLNPNRDLYLVTANDQRTDQQLLTEIETDPNAGRPVLNSTVTMTGGQSSTSTLQDDQSTASVLNDEQSTASVLNDDQSTASVLNDEQSTASVLNDDQSTASVLNDDQSTASVLNGEVDYYGTSAPSQYVNQPLMTQIAANNAHTLATGRGVIVALIDNGVDQFNPVLSRVLLARQGYNFYDGTSNWSAWADLNQSTASVLNDQSTASVLNDQSTASVLNDDQSTASVLNDEQSTASVLNDDQSTASVLNDQSTASVLNDDQSTASVLNALNKILAVNPTFGHGTSVAGLIHLVAPEAGILPIKAFGPDGTADSAVIYQSITYAIDQHANVINLSFSATDTTADIQDAIAEAVSDGIVVAAAAGNSNVNTAVYPASLPGVVGVGAVDACNAPAATTANPNPPCIANPSFLKASFSNFGTTDVDVAAPGVQLFTTYPGFGQLWATVSGTSFSTPLVAGEAALLVQLKQTGQGNRSDIENSSNPSIPGNLRNALGHGMIQVMGALLDAAPSHPGNNANGQSNKNGQGQFPGFGR